MKSFIALGIMMLCLHISVFSSPVITPEMRITPRTLVFAWEFGQSFQSGDPHIPGKVWDYRYYHIKTPIGRRSSTMYRFDLVGYSYGSDTPLDITWVGFPNSQDGKFKQTAAVNKSLRKMTVTQYFKDDFVYLKFGPLKRFHTSFTLYYQGYWKNHEKGLLTA